MTVAAAAPPVPNRKYATNRRSSPMLITADTISEKNGTLESPTARNTAE